MLHHPLGQQRSISHILQMLHRPVIVFMLKAEVFECVIFQQSTPPTHTHQNNNEHCGWFSKV